MRGSEGIRRERGGPRVAVVVGDHLGGGSRVTQRTQRAFTDHQVPRLVDIMLFASG